MFHHAWPGHVSERQTFAATGARTMAVDVARRQLRVRVFGVSPANAA